MDQVTVEAYGSALNQGPNLDQSMFTDPTDPNGGAASTGNSSWLGTAVQWVSQTADEVTNATWQIQDAAQSTQQAFARANNPQTTPYQKPAPDRMSTQTSSGIGIVLLLIGAFFVFGGHHG